MWLVERALLMEYSVNRFVRVLLRGLISLHYRDVANTFHALPVKHSAHVSLPFWRTLRHCCKILRTSVTRRRGVVEHNVPTVDRVCKQHRAFGMLHFFQQSAHLWFFESSEHPSDVARSL
jgi:hypothetical protein